MKALVACKRVVDYRVRVRVRSDGTGVELNNVKMSLNPFDEIALEEALRAKEKGVFTEVVAVSIGSAPCQEVLRTALALGADRAIHVVTQDGLEPLSVAELLKAIALQEQADVFWLGKQAIDDDFNQTGQMLAALLDWPQLCFVSEVHFESSAVQATRETDRGLETLRATLPAVITADLRLNTPRYATLPNIMKAKTKPLASVSPDELNVTVRPSPMTVVHVKEPAQRTAGIKVSSAQELVDALRQRKMID